MSPSPEAAPTAWHSLSPDEALARLEVERSAGLSSDEAQRRRERDGPNRLAEPPSRSPWLAFLDQFKSLLVGVLLGAAVLAGAIGDFKDATVIVIVVLFNAALGFWQEHRAEATLDKLKEMLSPTARARRGGQVSELEAEALVAGDIVLLETGDQVPADGRLLEARELEVDEASLTGESLAVTKRAREVHPEDTALAGRTNCAYMNTVVTRGRGVLVVTATGPRTEMGRVSELLAESEPGPTPLQAQLDGLGQRLTLIAGAVISLIFGLGMLRGQPLVESLLTSIALAVAAIPEGLPAVVTVTLALGMRRMAQQRAIVKRLAAVETLGCSTVICSDKTGTLTQNRMVARRLMAAGQDIAISGEGYGIEGELRVRGGAELPDLRLALEAATLANDAQLRGGELIGSPTEGALLALAGKAGVDADALRAERPRLAELPFDSEHKLMASFHDEGEQVRAYVKGAPDVLFRRVACDEAALADWRAANDGLAGEAMRVLALATRTLPKADFDPEGSLADHLSELELLALVGIIDPPRPEAREAIALCHRAGIAVKMITGDHLTTATAIARDLGLEGAALEGAELDALDGEARRARVAEGVVFARVTPEHKLTIVRDLQASGEVVAMTGDGVNDAPAVKQADIGVAMGQAGTAVTREAATMVLTDDNFATIVSAAREGRSIYENIVKFVRFQLSTNLGAIQTVLGASLMGWSSPFTAIQILWVNIIMDGPPAMSLGLEPSREGVMDEAPRPKEAEILNRSRLALLFAYGLLMAAGTLGMARYGARESEAVSRTLAFTTFVLFQFFNIFNARSERASVFRAELFTNRPLWIATAGVLGMQVLAVHWGPAQALFGTTRLGLTDWALAAGVASSILVFDELRKLLGIGLSRRPAPLEARDTSAAAATAA